MSRNIAPTKQNFGTIKDLTTIILCAGKGRRTASIGNKSLISTPCGHNLINHQIKTLQEKFPNLFDIIVVLGFEADKVARTLPHGIRVVENEKFDSTNISRSISMGVRAARSENIFVIYGDILFDGTVFNHFTQNSCVAVDEFGRFDESKIGVIIENYRVSNFAYGLNQETWAQINFFRGKELDLIRKITYNRDNDSLSGFEVLNRVLDKGGRLEACTVDKSSVLQEFNSIREIKNYKNVREDVE